MSGGISIPLMGLGFFNAWSEGENFLRLAVVSLFITLCIITYRHYKKLRTNLIISFNSDTHRIKNIPYRVNNISVDAKWLRIKLRNRYDNTARQCRPLLLNVVRLEDGKSVELGYTDRLQLNWSGIEKENTALDIFKDSEYFFAVFSVGSNNSVMLNTPHCPGNLSNLFSSQGIYRIKVQVIGDDSRSNILELDFAWTGQWDKLLVYSVSAT